ncbi:MAG: DNA polymerase III subunit alpha [Acidobacteriota bacterium]
MPRSSFVHLHNHSEYSLLDGSCRLRELVECAAAFDQPAVALTDHGNLFGALKFTEAARSAGVKPIIGLEAYMAVGSRHDRGGPAGAGRRKPYHHMILLARNYTGYRNLLKLVSLGYTEGFYYKPRIDREILAEHAEGLIGTSGCLGGEIPQLLLANRTADAERVAAIYAEMFGPEHFYIELQAHGIPEEEQVFPALVDLSARTSVPLLATNDCHYMSAADHFAHDVLICIQTGKTTADPRSLRFTDQHYFKSSEEMSQRFADYPESVENTLRVAGMCDLEMPDSGYQLPHFTVPGEATPDDYLRQVTRIGFESRRAVWDRLAAKGELRRSIEEYGQRLERELACIAEMGFSGYFLIVWDLIRHARSLQIPVGPGRGSAAGSLVAFCLGITNIDPLRYDLLFERFLNPERVTMPDIDIDFCMKRRGEVIDYVTETYGRENVAQIITFGTMAARGVIRDAGRGLNISFAQVDRIAKLVPPDLDATIAKALASVPALKEAYETDPAITQLLDVGQRLEGLARHASTHAAGVVIAPSPITDFAPLYQVKEGERTTQYSMGDIESIGLLKMDFLGLKTLTLIDSVVKGIRDGRREDIDLETLDLEDAATYALFCRGATSGVFQFESDGMRDILRKLRPERFEDLIALNALYRPGPLQGGLVDQFIERRHGKVKVDYPVGQLREILDETHGVIVYQEQVMKIASELGGFSLGEADLLRRAMGKKKKDLLAAQKKNFVDGAVQRSIDVGSAEKIFEQMEYFAGYGFNKSHSAAYALVAYQTAYLKAHYPVDFMAGLLTSERNNTEKVVAYMNECREMGIDVLPPDVNTSAVDFVPEGEAIRFGLSAIKNIGTAAIDHLISRRDTLGPFTSLQELAREVDSRQVNRRVFEALIKSGSLDGIFPVRARLMAALDHALEAGQRHQQDKALGQGALFGFDAAARAPEEALPECAAWTDHETLAFEKETLGFYLSGHPLTEYAREVEAFGSHSSVGLRGCPPGTPVAVAGMVAAIRKRKTRKGEWMAVVTLEDLEGTCEAVVFPRVLSRHGDLLVEDAAILVSGRGDSQGSDDRGRLLVDDIVPLKEARSRRAEGVTIGLQAPGLNSDTLDRLREALATHEGSVPVRFVLTVPDACRVIFRPTPEVRVEPGPALTDAVEALLGRGSLRLRLRAT